MGKIKYLFVVIFFAIFSCASTPKEEPQVEEPVIDVVVEEEPQVEEPVVVEEPVIIEEPVEEPAEEPVVIEETPIVEVEPFNDELLKNSRNLILRAEEARASTYFPQRLATLKSLLAKINQTKDNDPDLARTLLSDFNAEADSLITDSWKALKNACINILEDRHKQVIKYEGEKYAPSEFKTAVNTKEKALKSFETDDFTRAIADYRLAYTELTNLYNSLSKNANHFNNLLRRIELLYNQAMTLDVEKWAKDEYEVAYSLYTQGINELYTNYNAQNGEKLLLDTIFYGRKAIEQAKINITVYETDQEILRLMGDLESASTLTVVDDEDNIISPEEWKGDPKLKEKPIEANVEIDEESDLEEIDLDKDVEVEFPGVTKIQKGKTMVLGITEERQNLLDQAKEYWNLGIEARNSGNLLLAKEYLDKAQIFLDEYEAMAVSTIYTVQLNIEDRDCLWKIAGMDQFYADPYMWPAIWERNKKLIQDPDLIYPGWKLIIPPLK